MPAVLPKYKTVGERIDNVAAESTRMPPRTTTGLDEAMVVFLLTRRESYKTASQLHALRFTFCSTPLWRRNERLSSISWGTSEPLICDVNSTNTLILSPLRTSISCA